MINLIKGKIVDKTLSDITVLTAGGVGYLIKINPRHSERYQTGAEAEVLTHLIVREDVMDLYGFENEQEKFLFLQLLNVSGVGPKSAMHILSSGEVNEISSTISAGDAAYLTKVHGIGRKTAERITVELKDKVWGTGNVERGTHASSAISEVIEALVSMGYKEAQAREAVKNLDNTKSSEELLREVLKKIR